MRTSSRSKRPVVRATADAVVGLALLFAGMLVLCPLAHAQGKRASADSVLSAKERASLKRQLDAADSAKGSDLWEEYKKYRDDGNRHSTGERVKVGDSVVVEEDERILGDVVSIGGDVVVRGDVEGDVVSVGGDVEVHDGAKVMGDAVSVGGRVEKSDGATVLGETVSVNVPIPLFGLRGPEFHKPRFFTLGWKLAFFVVGLLLVLLFNAVAGHRLDVVSRRVESEPGQSFLIGLLGAFGTPIAMLIAFVLLAITIVGLLLFPVLLILVWLMMLGGFAAVAIAVGRRVVEGRGPADRLRPAGSSYTHLFVGFVLLHAFLIAGSIVRVIPWPLDPFGIFLAVLGWFVLVFATTMGYGAVLLSRLGKQVPQVVGAAGRPAPPPPPPPVWPAPPPPPSAPPPGTPVDPSMPGSGTT
jgi:hypothetical protein